MQMSFNLLNTSLVGYILIAMAVLFSIIIIVPIVKFVIDKVKSSKKKKREDLAKKAESDKKKNQEAEETKKKERFFETVAEKLENYEPINAKTFNIEDEYIPAPRLNEHKDRNFDDTCDCSLGKSDDIFDTRLDISSKNLDNDLKLSEKDADIMSFLESDENDASQVFRKITTNNGLFNKQQLESGNIYSDMFSQDKSSDKSDINIDAELEDTYNGYEIDDDELKELHDKDDEEYEELHKQLVKKRNLRMQYLNDFDRKRIQSLYDEIQSSSKRVQAIVLMDILNKKKF